ncbi:nucleoside hydrolase [Archangium violaceum]|uniref:nucleoside hydrolase n=1 Tax=Archangium violaceum TaxID=83451 RepID=UPI002B2837F7|nr:nucleoside hydrolase [Archangium violaceum]
MTRILFRRSVALAALLALGACVSPEPRKPVLVADVDADIDDISALAYLCQEHKLGRIELAAVTVTNTGAGYPGKALQYVRCTLAACGLTDVPVADGSRTATNLFPEPMRDGVERILSRTFEGCTQSTEPAQQSAPRLLADIFGREDLVRVVTLGPVTNVTEALKLEPELESHVEAVYVMGGAVSVPGNICCGAESQYDNSQEFNIMGDAAAARGLIEALAPEKVFLVPLDATRAVPVTKTFASRLESSRVGNEPATAEVGLVSRILSNPEVQGGIEFEMLYWWDPLTVVSATRPGVVSFETRSLDVVQAGASLGRTKVSSEGRRVRVGTEANKALFEELFLDSLNGR